MAQPAKAAEILLYLREMNFMWEPSCIQGNEDQINHITLKRNNGSTYTRKITKSHKKDLGILLPEGTEKEEVMKAFDLLSFKTGGGGGGGRTALSKADYISQSAEMGLTSNSAGLLQVNVAKLYDFPQGSTINRNGKDSIAFERRDFDFSFDAKTKTITLKLKTAK